MFFFCYIYEYSYSLLFNENLRKWKNYGLKILKYVIYFYYFYNVYDDCK